MARAESGRRLNGDGTLLQDWPDDGPPLLWTAKGLGRGMSSVSVADGRILTMGNRGGKVHLIALDAENGEKIWSTPLEADGDPNGTPTIDGEHVFAITYNGALVCAETATGRVLWQKDFVKDFGGKVPTWGYSESPLVDGDVVVCTPGARRALIVALNKTTGETVWKTTAPAEMHGRGHGGAGYSSIVDRPRRRHSPVRATGRERRDRRFDGRRHAAVGLQPHRQRRGQHSHAHRSRRLRLCIDRLRRRGGAAAARAHRPTA